jgi:hypothetical protein
VVLTGVFMTRAVPGLEGENLEVAELLEAVEGGRPPQQAAEGDELAAAVGREGAFIIVGIEVRADPAGFAIL